jgi:hypothetical protein
MWIGWRSSSTQAQRRMNRRGASASLSYTVQDGSPAEAPQALMSLSRTTAPTAPRPPSKWPRQRTPGAGGGLRTAQFRYPCVLLGQGPGSSRRTLSSSSIQALSQARATTRTRQRPASPPASGTAVMVFIGARIGRRSMRCVLPTPTGLAMTFHRTAVQSRRRHGYYVGSRRGSTFDIAPDQLACIHHDVGVRVNETNGNSERQR